MRDICSILVENTKKPALLGALAAALLSSASPFGAYANPVGGVVSGGSATIGSNGNVLTVNQSTNRAVIDWRGFDIAPHETTRFVQPNAGSWTLNRVNAANPSLIQGNLVANGNIAIINPNGVIFSGTSRVDAAGVIASTANISNANFMAGNMKFDQAGNPDAKIINEGTITAKQAGLVGLVAPTVENSGVIEAKLGKVVLAAGDTFTVDMAGDGIISVAVSHNVARQLVKNTGNITADGGRIILTAAAGRNLVDSLIDSSGSMRAQSVGVRNGEIIIRNNGGDVKHTGTLDARGLNAGEKGGDIRVYGRDITLGSGSVITAAGRYGKVNTINTNNKTAMRGKAAGGDIKIGGDYLGTGNDPHARNVTVETGAIIDASSTHYGDAGRVIVWSDGHTQMDGTILVKGGGLRGDGGFAETSGKHTLGIGGWVDAGAENGRGGLWLLDPTNISITGATANVTGNPYTPNADDAVSTISAATIQGVLDGGTSVTVQTRATGTQAGNLTVSSAISWSGAANLTLIAHNNIALNTITYTGATDQSFLARAGQHITGGSINANGTGRLDITLHADSDGVGVGGITTQSFKSNGGDILLSGGLNPLTGYAYASSTGNIGIRMGSGSSLDARRLSDGDGGNITMRGQGSTNTGLYLNSTQITTNGDGNISIYGKSDSTYGTYIGRDSFADPVVQTENGDIHIEVDGGNSATTSWALQFFLAHIQATNDGNITIIGRAGVGTTSAYGVLLNSSTIDSKNGTIEVTANGGTGTNSIGLYMNNAYIESEAGDITVEGTGGTSLANINPGVLLRNSHISATGMTRLAPET